MKVYNVDSAVQGPLAEPDPVVAPRQPHPALPAGLGVKTVPATKAQHRRNSVLGSQPRWIAPDAARKQSAQGVGVARAHDKSAGRSTRVGEFRSARKDSSAGSGCRAAFAVLDGCRTPRRATHLESICSSLKTPSL